MKVDNNKHRKVMLRILAEISSDSLLANNLGFKGGTACYFLHGLDRFSVDLDFDILDQDKEVEVREQLLHLLNDYGSVKTKTSIKVKYSDYYQSLKIDLSNRYKCSALNTYVVKDIVSGVSLRVLRKEDIFAHKLIALIDRSASSAGDTEFIANRDLYDIHFFFKSGWEFNGEIIESQTGKASTEYLQDVAAFIERTVNESNILARLGELVDEEKREWVKSHLKSDVLKQLAIEISASK